ncbi:MAG: hypothetical protein AAF639_05035 [Chloroflexota bacterium]
MEDAMVMGSAKHRLNTHLTEDAYDILIRYTSPRTVGKFLSNLLVNYHNQRSLLERVESAEKEIADIKAQVVLDEVKNRLKTALLNPEEETIPFEQVIKELNLNVDYQPQT